MVSAGLAVRVVSLALLASGCGNGAPTIPGDGASGGSGPGAGEDGGSATHPCESDDGVLKYGPIGEPWPVPLKATTTSTGDCSWCSSVDQAVGFRTAAGYGFVWLMGTDSDAPGPNLFSMTVGPSFEGGEPRALLAPSSVDELDVISAQDEYVAAFCSRESGPDWKQLNGDLEVSSDSELVRPEVFTQACPPPLVWNGVGYLTAFADSRGLVVALLDERGAIWGEEILSETSSEVRRVRLSRNGDRVLVVFEERDDFRYGVVDLQGAPLGDVQLVTEESGLPLAFTIAASGDGWLVLGGSSAGRMTGISRDGLIWNEQSLPLSGYVFLLRSAPSAYGGTLLVGTLDSGGQFGATYDFQVLLSQAGEVLFSRQVRGADTLAIVHDPWRDLVLEQRALDGSEPITVVQEYGCLD